MASSLWSRRALIGGISLAAGAAMLWSAAPAAAQETPRRGGTLVFAVPGDPPHFNIAITSDTTAQQIATHMFSPLVRVDSEGKIQGELAESWSMSPDGLTYTFKIRRNVKWHDGKPLTAEDVRWALTEINMKHTPVAATGLAAVDSIAAPDDATLVFKLKYPFPPFMPWSFLGLWIYPKHLYDGTDPRQNPRNRTPVGTGPYVFKEYVRGSHVVMERNPDHYKPGQPYLDRIVAKVIPDDSARLVALEKGEVDYLSIYALSPTSVPELRKNRDVGILVDRNRVNYGSIMAHINVRNDVIKLKEARQALSYAVDRKILVERAMAGLADPASSPVSSLHQPWYNPAVANRYPHDPKKAQDLLEQAGLKRGADGKRFSIRITYGRTAEAGALQSAAELMREQFRAVGVDLVLEPRDNAAWMESAHTRWDFDLSMGSYQTGPDPAIAVSRLYVTSNIKRLPGTNLMGYSNPKVDELFDIAAKELDVQKRVKMYHDVQDLLVEDVPALWLWDKASPLAFRTRVKGPLVGGTHQEAFDAVWVTDGK